MYVYSERDLAKMSFFFFCFGGGVEGSYYYSVGLTGEWVVVKGHAAFFSGERHALTSLA